jgi:hypothetical protein
MRVGLVLAVCFGGCGGGQRAPADAESSLSGPTQTLTGSTTGPCEETSSEQQAVLQSWFDELTLGVDGTPVDRVLDDGGNGRLEVGLAPDALPILVGPDGVHMAVTTIGEGRVVAFSGQDFLSSGDRSTLLGDAEVAALLQNSVAWAGRDVGGPLTVLADNDAVAATVGAEHEVRTAAVVEEVGLRQIRDWSADAVEGVDVLIVQINEWGTLHVADEDLPTIEAFVRDGGGLLIAGAAEHWSWWLFDQGPEYPGDALLGAHGITWPAVSVADMTQAELAFDELASPEALWCAYVSGSRLGDEVLPRVAPLFRAASAAGRALEVDAGLVRLIEESPALPTDVSHGGARLAADVAVELAGVGWPSGHPWAKTFPGDVVDGAERVDLTVDLDTRFKRHRPLGAYAAPGDVVTVGLPTEHVGTGLILRIGEYHDDLRPLEHIASWERAPMLFSEVALTATTTSVGHGLGGALYIEVPDAYDDLTLEVELGGVVPMAVYTHGETDEAAFAEVLAAGAPRAILQGEGKVRMVVDAVAAASADPSDVLDFWGPFYDSHAHLAQEPVPRSYASHWLFDPQVGYGYANATSGRINFPELATSWALRTQTGDEDWWLFAHEMGHQFQTSDWTSGDVTEVCVNLWSMYTINGYIHGGGDFETQGHQDNVMDHAALVDMRWGTADLFGKLEMYRQLVFEFGWGVYVEVMASYHDPAYPRSEYGSFMDGFALRFSAISGRDITPFLVHWEYPLTDEARAQVQAWGLPEWLPPGW